MSIWTEWDPLEEVIVGDCHQKCPDEWLIPDNSRELLDVIFRETKEDLDNLAKCLEKLDVKVYRPNVLTFPLNIDLGNFSITNAMSPMVPRDQYLVYDKTILQTYTSMPSRYLDSFSYYDIFLAKFLNGYNWLSQPPPVLKNLDTSKKWQSNGPEIYGKTYKYKLLWHAATSFKCGDTIIVNNGGPGTALGLKWAEKNLNTKFHYNINTCENSWGHIDQGFFMIDDETVCCSEMQWVPHILRNKRIVEFKGHYTPYNYSEIINKTSSKRNEMSFDWLSEWLLEWKGYAQDMAAEFNVLVVDSKNVIFSPELPGVFKILSSLGVNCHVCKFRHAAFWEAGIHCLTLDIKRRGNKRSIIAY